MGLHSTGEKIPIDSKVGSDENIVILRDFHTKPLLQSTVIPSPITDIADLPDGIKAVSGVTTAVNSVVPSLTPISPRLQVDNPIDVHVTLTKAPFIEENDRNGEEDYSPANKLTTAR